MRVRRATLRDRDQRDAMRIREIRHRLVAVPVAHRIVSSVRDTGEQLFLLVDVLTHQELTGRSYVSTFSVRRGRAIRALLDELAEVICGMDATDTETIWSRMWESARLIGHGGLSAFAMSAVDIALWDIKAKAQSLPLHSLLGPSRRRLPAYASDGCWLEEPTSVANQAERFAAAGFSAVKVRFGRRDPEDDIRALEAVRGAVGGAVEVLIDVNQGWQRDRARAYGARLPAFGVRWLEEPLPSEDIAGLADLRRALPLDIVAGENAYMPDGARQLLDSAAVDVLTPDLQRIGGVTGWIRTRDLAHERATPLMPHLFPEVNVHLLAGEPSGSLEWVSWLSPLLVEPLDVHEGSVAVPDGPGIGLDFDDVAVHAHEVE